MAQLGRQVRVFNAIKPENIDTPDPDTAPAHEMTVPNVETEKVEDAEKISR